MTARRPRATRRFCRKAALLLFLAFLPVLTYMGHWPFGPPPEQQPAKHSSQHQTHCHLGPSTCSDQPAPPNARAFPDLVELPAPRLSAQLIADSVSLYHEFVPAPPDQPPRSA